MWEGGKDGLWGTVGEEKTNTVKEEREPCWQQYEP